VSIPTDDILLLTRNGAAFFAMENIFSSTGITSAPLGALS
jgi:hypothetical protein